MKRKMTRQDIAFCLELESMGVKKIFIAHYIFGISVSAYYHRKKTWGAL